jgi:hypothetical protein
MCGDTTTCPVYLAPKPTALSSPQPCLIIHVESNRGVEIMWRTSLELNEKLAWIGLKWAALNPRQGTRIKFIPFISLQMSTDNIVAWQRIFKASNMIGREPVNLWRSGSLSWIASWMGWIALYGLPRAYLRRRELTARPCGLHPTWR